MALKRSHVIWWILVVQVGSDRYDAPMYIEAVPNRDSPPAILLRESYREAGKVKKRTLLNLSDWPHERIAGFKALLKGGTVIPQDQDAITTAPKPLAVQPPFAARRQQAIGNQHEQDLIPVRSPAFREGRLFAARPQPLRPELIELQLTPQHQRQPARTPLP